MRFFRLTAAFLLLVVHCVAKMESMKSLNLSVLGFCGPDDNSSPELMQLLSKHYSWIEWGIIFKGSEHENKPRHPSWSWVEKLAKVNDEGGNLMKLAGHLCGVKCQEFLDGDLSFVSQLDKHGFRRIQVNAHGEDEIVMDSDRYSAYVENIIQFLITFPEIELIIQQNSDSQDLCNLLKTLQYSNISFLFDSSCGKGVLLSAETLTPPPEDINLKFGYAGGIGPDTIRSVLLTIEDVVEDRAFGIDMESSLRVVTLERDSSSRDLFSIEKCFQCIQIGVDWFGLKKNE